MHVVTRRNSGHGAKELCDLIVQRKDEVETLGSATVAYDTPRRGGQW
jgi:hypothetical protein